MQILIFLTSTLNKRNNKIIKKKVAIVESN